MHEIKVGIIGAGGIAGGKHLPGHRNVEGVSIIAVCDIDQQRAENFAKQHDIKQVFTDYNALVAMPELDAVSVCTPNNFHAPPSIAALEAGKHVICEKPSQGMQLTVRRWSMPRKRREKCFRLGYNHDLGQKRGPYASYMKMDSSAIFTTLAQWQCDDGVCLLHHRLSRNQ